jgi:hypothetical protein
VEKLNFKRKVFPSSFFLKGGALSKSKYTFQRIDTPYESSGKGHELLCSSLWLDLEADWSQCAFPWLDGGQYQQLQDIPDQSYPEAKALITE